MTDRAAPSNWMLALLACAQLIIALDATIVFVALPEISRALDFSAQRLQWVVSAYTVAFGGFLLLGGRATDLLGRRRMYVLGQSLYALASLAGGLAQSELPLILARAAQGLPVDIRAEISYLHRDGQLRVMYIDAQVGEMLKQIPAQLGADLRRFQGELLVGTLSLYLKGAYKLQLLL